MKKTKQAQAAAAMLEQIDTQLEPILHALIERAQAGNVQAAKLVLEYRAVLLRKKKAEDSLGWVLG